MTSFNPIAGNPIGSNPADGQTGSATLQITPAALLLAAPAALTLRRSRLDLTAGAGAVRLTAKPVTLTVRRSAVANTLQITPASVGCGAQAMNLVLFRPSEVPPAPVLTATGGAESARRSPSHSARYLDTLDVKREFEQMLARRESYRKPAPTPPPEPPPPPPPPVVGSLTDVAPRPEIALLRKLQEQARARYHAELLARISGDAPPAAASPAHMDLLKRL